jgi:hypothetical protein
MMLRMVASLIRLRWNPTKRRIWELVCFFYKLAFIIFTWIASKAYSRVRISRSDIEAITVIFSLLHCLTI